MADKIGFSTRAIHDGEEPNMKEGGSGDVSVPIHLSSTFARKEVDKPTGGYDYSRSGNPTRYALEKKLAAIEGAEFGLAFSSGLAAESVLLMSLLKAGSHVVAFDDLYGGTKRLFNKVFAKFGIEFDYVDMREVNRVEKAVKGDTNLIWIESPTNPLMKLCDIRAISEIGKKCGALVVVDNTFASPYLQNPLRLGADLVLHSTTKYINGHSDSVGGAIMLSDSKIHEELKFNQNAIGAILSPFDSYLVARGIKTLSVRMEKHSQNAMKIADYLESHPGVAKVNYPGLKSHPQHELAKTQMSGFGGMLSFEIKGGLEESKKFLQHVNIFALAESLGGVESLIEHPALMTHASVPKADREKVGITDSLIRVSVGIENADDLIADLDGAFRKI